jgi:elongation factor Ts
MEINKADIIKLREKTKAGVMDVRKALTEAEGDLTRAEEILKKIGATKAESRTDRATGSGIVETYTHGDGKIGVIIEVACETDFVARTEEFKNLSHELALQVAALDPTSVDELLSQEYVRDPGRKVAELIADVIAKTGENIKVKRFQRFVLGT